MSLAALAPHLRTLSRLRGSLHAAGSQSSSGLTTRGAFILGAFGIYLLHGLFVAMSGTDRRRRERGWSYPPT